ncbi:MAG TPA: AraC family transcriptional regulator [Bacillota bacterium]|jgi:predicted transcriptional regulator|nr:AraC family transcriptional regulator [Bacillota bacterium]
MLVRDAGEKAGLKLLAGEAGTSRELKGVYICDLLSWVMAHASKGDAWITVQTHANIVAVAALLELGCIIVPEGVEVEEDTLKKAEDEGVAVYQSDLSAYGIAKELYRMGIE